MNLTDLKYLIVLCDQEIGHYGLNAAAGRQAAEMKRKLEEMRAMVAKRRKNPGVTYLTKLTHHD